MFEQFKRLVWEWRGAIITVSNVTALITLVRLLGWFQPLAWSSLDLLFKIRPQEPPDNRIIIVGLEETDIQKYKQWPISDHLLAKLITKIKTQNPRVIGLDLHRDIPVPPGYKELTKVFKTTPHLIGIQKVSGDQFYPTIAPPPILKELGQVSASDLVIDRDGVLRRAILFPRTPEQPALPSFGLAVAFEYLKKERIHPTPSTDGGWLKLGNTIFYPLQKNEGSYLNVGTAEYQIILNYRGAKQAFQKVSFTQVLENEIAADLFKDKIVLIGSRAISLKDYFYTPYSKGENSSPLLTYGVEIHANVTSQIISTVLDHRSLIRTWPEPVEYLWIFGWILLPSVWAWQWRTTQNAIKLFSIISLGTIAFSVILLVSVYLAFLNAWWISVISPLFGLGLSSIIISFTIYISRLQEANLSLEKKVKERTQELEENNQQLKSTLHQLENTQQQIIAQEKLAYLGVISAGITHEIRNPVNLIKNFADLSLELEQELQELLKNVPESLNDEESQNIHESLSLILENLVTIKNQTQRIDLIIKALLPQANTQDLTPSLTNINQLLDTAYKLVHHSKKSHNNTVKIKLVTNYAPSLKNIKVVVPELTQALINIIDNAYDAVTLKQQTHSDNYKPTISLITKDLGASVEIGIYDNGLGIPLELQTQIFQPFVTTKLRGSGTGLGLSITHDIIVGKHRGELKFETEVGCYTKFIVTLPKKL
ncbi:CHASE2 domain-containing protein [Chroococcus sp. FPU101]|uniref:CHASE2 domain-containing protein n=1 Tax=Chroococcus sp. FPU101 TaxID=1974212 RepID=UPI001A8FA750|nr:CHASE2 domain-containing protein [Chroococcus sp. FPU101]GFE72058.1 hypothetical protein CFPU101_46680 [Chroococcus sp. FPU101]